MSAHARLSRIGAIEANADGGLRILFSAAALDDPRGIAIDACGNAGCGGCRTAGTPRSFTLSAADVARGDQAALAPGQRAELSVAVAGLSASAAWAFGVPLAGLIGGAWAGANAAGPDSGEFLSVALGLSGLVVGLAWFRRRSAQLAAALAPRVRIAAQPRGALLERAANGASIDGTDGDVAATETEVSDGRRFSARSEVRR